MAVGATSTVRVLMVEVIYIYAEVVAVARMVAAVLLIAVKPIPAAASSVGVLICAMQCDQTDFH